MTDQNASPPPANAEAAVCPICSAALTAAPASVAADGNLWCRAHGVWLPNDGLRRIIDGIKSRDLARMSRGLREEDYRFDRHPELVMLGASLRQTFGGMFNTAPPPPDRARIPPHPQPVPNVLVVAEGQRRCPSCQQMMVSSQTEGVVADVCAAHGIWLDVGELALVIRHVEAEDAERAQRIAEGASGSRVRALMNDRARAAEAGGAISAGIGVLGGLMALVGWAEDHR